MKKLSLLMGSLIALSGLMTNASATSVDTAEVVASVQVYHYGVREIHLLEDGRLQVDTGDEVVTRQLGQRATQILLNDVQDLAKAELKVTERENICYFFIAPYSPVLLVEGREVLTAGHCGIKTV